MLRTTNTARRSRRSKRKGIDRRGTVSVRFIEIANSYELTANSYCLRFIDQRHDDRRHARPFRFAVVDAGRLHIDAAGIAQSDGAIGLRHRIDQPQPMPAWVFGFGEEAMVAELL